MRCSGHTGQAAAFDANFQARPVSTRAEPRFKRSLLSKADEESTSLIRVQSSRCCPEFEHVERTGKRRLSFQAAKEGACCISTQARDVNVRKLSVVSDLCIPAIVL